MTFLGRHTLGGDLKRTAGVVEDQILSGINVDGVNVSTPIHGKGSTYERMLE
jgi:hypothetical protein